MSSLLVGSGDATIINTGAGAPASRNFVIPQNVAVGDILLFVVRAGITTVGEQVVVNSPAGWVRLCDLYANATVVDGAVFIKVATAIDAPGSNVNVAATPARAARWAGGIFRTTGIDYAATIAATLTGNDKNTSSVSTTVTFLAGVASAAQSLVVHVVGYNAATPMQPPLGTGTVALGNDVAGASFDAYIPGLAAETALYVGCQSVVGNAPAMTGVIAGSGAGAGVSRVLTATIVIPALVPVAPRETVKGAGPMRDVVAATYSARDKVR